MDLTCIFHELKATHLHTLNRERAELIAERWLADGVIFNAEEVNLKYLTILEMSRNMHGRHNWTCEKSAVKILKFLG